MEAVVTRSNATSTLGARRVSLLVLVLASACVDRGGGGAPGKGTTHGETQTGEGGDSAVAADSTTSSATGSGVGNCRDESPPYSQCDKFLQDCPPGERCVSGWSDGDYLALCNDEAEGYRKLGEPCDWEIREIGSFFSSDNCEKGLTCFAFRCVPMCAGGPGNVYCDDPELQCAYEAGAGSPECEFSACLQPCDPTNPDCDPDAVCDVYAGAFYCAPHYKTFPVHAPCGPGACATGLFCDAYLPEDAYTCGNETDGPGSPCEDPYCQRYCSLDDPESCPPHLEKPQECVPWFGSDTPPRGYANLGRCRVIEN